jgi:ABC-type lipoprotein export system ATPase subunit
VGFVFQFYQLMPWLRARGKVELRVLVTLLAGARRAASLRAE